MTLLRSVLLAALLAASPAWAQAPKTTEQQARSYILSAFMTGAAPAVLSDDVAVPAALRERLALAPDSDSRAVYYALVRLTAGKSLTVRPAKIDELERAATQFEPGKPVFALDVSDTTFVLKYDLDRDTVTNVADASRPVAVTTPVAAPEPPQPIAAPTAAAGAEPEKAPAPATAAEPAKAAAPEPLPGARVQVIEPREPRFNKPVPPPPAKAAAVASTAPMQVTHDEPRRAPLKPSGPCVIKPVMSDQDLVNCGATPR
jgi:hypothetical protein